MKECLTSLVIVMHKKITTRILSHLVEESNQEIRQKVLGRRCRNWCFQALLVGM